MFDNSRQDHNRHLLDHEVPYLKLKKLRIVVNTAEMAKKAIKSLEVAILALWLPTVVGYA